MGRYAGNERAFDPPPGAARAPAGGGAARRGAALLGGGGLEGEFDTTGTPAVGSNHFLLEFFELSTLAS